MSRYQAALIHLGISVLIAATAAALLLGIWYPEPYFGADGGRTLLMLIVGVDVTLGPLMTLVVFKSGKKGLAFDLSVIALLQATALAYGFWVMLQARPVFLVASVDRFVLVAANQLDPKDMAKASRAEWAHLSWSGPVLVGARLPPPGAARNALMFSGLGGKDLEDFPQYYVPYPQAAPGLLKHAHPLAVLERAHVDAKAMLGQWLTKRGRTAAQVVWVPLVAHDQDLSMLLDAASGQPLGAVALDPWVGEAAVQAVKPTPPAVAASAARP